MIPVEELVALRGAACHWCGIETNPAHRDKALRPTREHMVPRSRGGSDETDNLVVACAACNHARADLGDTPDPLRRAVVVQGLAGKTVPSKRRAKRARRRNRIG